MILKKQWRAVVRATSAPDSPITSMSGPHDTPEAAIADIRRGWFEIPEARISLMSQVVSDWRWDNAPS